MRLIPILPLVFVGLTALSGCAGQDATSSVTPATGSNGLLLGSGFAAEKRQGKTTGTTELTACKLWVGDKPDFMMTLTDQPFGGLRIRVLSEGGAKPVVRYPKGTFCAKEIDGAPPTVTRGAWSKDTYEVYIGVPEKGQTVDYTLEVFEER